MTTYYKTNNSKLEYSRNKDLSGETAATDIKADEVHKELASDLIDKMYDGQEDLHDPENLKCLFNTNYAHLFLIHPDSNEDHAEYFKAALKKANVSRDTINKIIQAAMRFYSHASLQVIRSVVPVIRLFASDIENKDLPILDAVREQVDPSEGVEAAQVIGNALGCTDQKILDALKTYLSPTEFTRIKKYVGLLL